MSRSTTLALCVLVHGNALSWAEGGGRLISSPERGEGGESRRREKHAFVQPSFWGAPAAAAAEGEREREEEEGGRE